MSVPTNHPVGNTLYLITPSSHCHGGGGAQKVSRVAPSLSEMELLLTLRVGLGEASATLALFDSSM